MIYVTNRYQKVKTRTMMGEERKDGSKHKRQSRQMGEEEEKAEQCRNTNTMQTTSVKESGKP